MNVIKAGAQQPKSFTRPSKKKKKVLIGGGWHSIQRTYVTSCLLESIVTSQISIQGGEWKGLTSGPVFLPKLISFATFWQVWLFCQRMSVRVFLIAERNVLSLWLAVGS